MAYGRLASRAARESRRAPGVRRWRAELLLPPDELALSADHVPAHAPRVSRAARQDGGALVPAPIRAGARHVGHFRHPAETTSRGRLRGRRGGITMTRLSTRTL